MKILCLTAHGPYRAGKVAYDLHHAFNTNGYESKLMTIYDDSNDKDIISIYNSKQWKRLAFKKKLVRKFKKVFGKSRSKTSSKVDSKYQFFEYDITNDYFSSDLILKKLDGYLPDVIIVLFTTQFITTHNIKQLALKTNATVLWQFLDMAPLTGGCHYAWECEGYKNNCSFCPALFSHNEDNQAAVNLRYKQSNTEGYDLRLMIASKWDEQNTKASTLFKHKRLYRTFMSVEPDVFTPDNRMITRKDLGINEDEFVIFFGSVHFGEERKGMTHLLEALQLVKNKLDNIDKSKPITLIIAGITNNFPIEELPFKYKLLGYLKEVNQLADAYAAADMFLCPSIYDSGPVMINQSMMTGTPVVAFEMGVAFDLIESGKTGYLAKWADASDLAKGILSLHRLSNNERELMRKQCRQKSLALFSPDAVVADYTSIFEEIKKEKSLP